MTTSAHHEEDSHEVPAYVHNSKKTTQSLQDGSAYPKPFRSQKRIASEIRLAPAPQLRERSSPNLIHGTRYMVHGTSTWYMKGYMSKRIGKHAL